MPAKKSPDPSELKIALENRAFEIQLFWQRSNYFLVLMTALGIGTFSIKDAFFSTGIALFATVCSYYWFRTNLGSKFWQESWEVEVTELSKELGVRSFERSLEDVREQVRASLAKGQQAEKRTFIRVWIDRMTVKKYSVTYNMILLSLVSTFVWALVAATLVFRSSAVFFDPDIPPPVEAVTSRVTPQPSVPVQPALPKPAKPEANGPATSNVITPVPQSSDLVATNTAS